MQREDSPKLRDVLDKSYPRLHAEGAFLGKSWIRHAKIFAKLAGPEATEKILDYGCGPDGGLANAYPGKVHSYDPYVEQYAAPIKGLKFTSVFTCDVVEHMTLAQIVELLAKVRRCDAQFLYMVAATRISESKKLDNGLNVHITVQPAQWWFGVVQAALPDFDPVHVVDDLLRDECVLAFRRKDASDANRESVRAA